MMTKADLDFLNFEMTWLGGKPARKPVLFNSLSDDTIFYSHGQEFKKIPLIIIKSMFNNYQQHEANARFTTGKLQGEYLYLDPKENWTVYV